jgi:polyhydroxybutyrate depolymerase
VLVAGCAACDSRRASRRQDTTPTTASIPDDSLETPQDHPARSVEPRPSAGCRDDAESYERGSTTVDTLVHDGRDRSFRVFVPDSVDRSEPAPVVILFHGGFGSGEKTQKRGSSMDEVAREHGFVTVYPDGLGLVPTWNGGECCGYAARRDVDDVGFVDAMLDRLEQKLCVDTHRIYAGGMSNGGIMSYRLACELSGRIAAIAPVAGADVTISCEPERAVPVLHIHGSDDANVPIEGGEGCGAAKTSFTPLSETMETWRERGACGEEREVSLEIGDGICRTYRGCERADVTECIVKNGGHSWPGGPRHTRARKLLKCEGDGHHSTTFPADRVMWKFFREHPMR